MSAFLARQQKTLLITSVIPRHNAFAAWRIHLFLMEAFFVCLYFKCTDDNN